MNEAHDGADGPTSMELSAFLTPNRVIANVAVADKGALLAELGRRAGILLGMDGAAIAELLEKRERLGSTGLGRGFALPHARLDRLERFFGMFLRLARPIPFDAVDDQPVSMIFLLLSPRSAEDCEHLAALAAISRRMKNPEFASRLQRERVGRLFALLVGGRGEEAA